MQVETRHKPRTYAWTCPHCGKGHTRVYIAGVPRCARCKKQVEGKVYSLEYDPLDALLIPARWGWTSRATMMSVI